MDAAEAERCGLVSRVLTPEQLLPEAINVAVKLAQLSRSGTVRSQRAGQSKL